jgi:hypothetical protein
MKQFLYLFLFDRAKIVHSALGLNGIVLRMVRWLIVLASIVGIPLLVCVYTGARSRVLPETGTCIQYIDSTWAIAVVASLDFVLSMAMLTVFIVPLTKHAHSDIIVEYQQGKSFHRLIRRNLTLSIILVISTLISLLFMTIERSIVFGSNPDPNLEHLQIWSTIAPEIDTFVTVLGVHLLTTSWIPPPITKTTGTYFIQSTFANQPWLKDCSLRPHQRLTRK